MTKERFMQIAEEVGIASSDWKEDLWRAHLTCAMGLTLSDKGEEEAATLACQWALEDGRVSFDRLRRATRD